MAFQSTVSLNQGFGVIGELFDNGPSRAQPYTLVSASAAYNVFGSAFTITSQGVAAAGNTGTAVFAGILGNPKTNPLFGAGGIPLNPSLTLPNYSIGELIFEGEMIVTLPGAAAIGDLVIYDNTTGVLSTITPVTALPMGKSSAHAVVSRYTVTGAGLAVIRLLNAPIIPT